MAALVADGLRLSATTSGARTLVAKAEAEAVAVAQEPPALVLIPGMKMGVGPGRELETVQEAVNPATI
jgi:hypothetical protein